MTFSDNLQSSTDPTKFRLKEKSDHNTRHFIKNKTGLIAFSFKFQNKGVLYRKGKTLKSVAYV